MQIISNTIFNKSCEDMSDLPDDSVNLIVTSPPYYSLKEYATWPNYNDYLGFIDKVTKECFRVLEPGGWICWNVQESVPFPPEGTRERYSEPLVSDSIVSLKKAGFKYEKGIVWYKGQGTATQRMFGSYPKPGLLLVSGLTEQIILMRKWRGSYKKSRSESDISKSLISKDEWAKWTLDLWEVRPESASRIGHPAPYPVEIPYRLIRMFSFYGDLVLDPFWGSGTTGVASKRSGRNYVGYEIHKEYIEKSQKRIETDESVNGDLFETNKE